MKRIVILGGSFNPVHNGHLRLALETGEALAADRVDFVPSFRPPHKPQPGLLPFELRLKALELALKGYAGIKVNLFEAASDEPSYSIHTLLDYAGREPEAELVFVLGLYDFSQIKTWYRWAELVRHASLLAVPRQGGGEDEFIGAARVLWPGCEREAHPHPLVCLNPWSAGINSRAPATRLYYLPIPRLDVSSSLIREKWLAGRSLDFLAPDSVLELLTAHAEEVQQAWASCGG